MHAAASLNGWFQKEKMAFHCLSFEASKIHIVATIGSACFLGSTGTSRIVRKGRTALTKGKTSSPHPDGFVPPVPTFYENGEIFPAKRTPHPPLIQD
jgi:hypothetical protein